MLCGSKGNKPACWRVREEFRCVWSATGLQKLGMGYRDGPLLVRARRLPGSRGSRGAKRGCARLQGARLVGDGGH